MKKKLPSETVHELNCLRNTVKQLKSANEYHKGKIAMYELQSAESAAGEKQSGIIITLLFLALFWSNAYHFLIGIDYA